MTASGLPSSAQLPETIARYRVQSLLGTGEFANVYLALDEELSRHVAIKVPASSRAYSSQQFLDEARKAASLGPHPAIVAIHDFGEWHDDLHAPRGAPYVVMDFIPGGTLFELVDLGQLSHDRVAEIMALVAEAAHHAHKRGLIHRDLKLENILMNEHGRPCIADFGLAVHRGGQLWAQAGTLPYMSPEQILSKKLDGRTDVWSMGVILYKMLTGKFPFDPEADRLAVSILSDDPDPPLQCDDSIPIELQTICLKCLAKNPRDRYSSALQLAKDLEPFGSRPRVFCLHRRASPHFTGRGKILQHIQRLFRSQQVVALTGLGGTGKTQIALRYADQYSREYDAIFWANAASHKTLVSDFTDIAIQLHLVQGNDSDQTRIVERVLNWLQREKTHHNWLLILDNADDLRLVRGFIPTTAHGRVLITTRESATGDMAHSINVPNFTLNEATLFLLRRSKRIPFAAPLKDALPRDRRIARSLAREFDALPLALLQAGAYIEETKCSFPEYFSLYKTNADRLLAEQGEYAYDYPESVATTWMPSFKKTAESCPAAADVLRFCAFLSPDSIPEEIILQGAAHLGEHLCNAADDPFEFRKTIKEACRFSLMSRNRTSQSYDMHRLVQRVLRDRMRGAGRQLWAERTVLAVSRVFPDADFAAWRLCDRLLPHAMAAATLIDAYNLSFPEAAVLLRRIAAYLMARGQYSDAEQLFQQSIRLQEREDRTSDDTIAKTLNGLGWLYRLRGNYTKAEEVLLKALSIREAALSHDDPDLAATLNGLAVTYANLGKSSDAEPLYLRALEIRKTVFGTNHRVTAGSLNNLATLRAVQGNYTEAESLYRETLAIKESVYDHDNPTIALTLNNLSDLYLCQARYADAEPVAKRAFKIRAAYLPPSHPYVLWSILNLAIIYHNTDKTSEADRLCDRVLEIARKASVEPHRGVARALKKLAAICESNHQLEKAQAFAKWASDIRSSVQGVDLVEFV